MPVQDTHPQYDEYKSRWQDARDAACGQYAIHKAGVRYLPKLSGQDDDEYKAYMGRALFYEATGRTIQGLGGMIFRKPPEIEFGGMEAFTKDVTLRGDSLRAFSEDITRQVLEVNRVGVLIDYPVMLENDIVTAAQVEALNMRPYFRTYKAESITNWKTGTVNNESVLTQVRLTEIEEIELDDYEVEQIPQIRVLTLDEGVYKQKVYRQDNKKKWVLFSEITPTMNGQSMSFIPFVFFSSNGSDSAVEQPDLTGLVNVNISHYKTTADLEHGAHFTGLPTAVITGIQSEDAEGQEFKIGSTTAWAFTNESANAKYLEFTGQGLGALVERCKSKEEQMASLGAQMLAPQARRNEAVETAQMRHMGENSILANVSQAISEGLNVCMMYAGQWMGLEPATIALSRDFSPTPMTPQMLKELVMTWQSGAISYDTLYENLREGEIIQHDKTIDEEKDKIQSGEVIL